MPELRPVVSNTGPIIGLSSIGQLDLLPSLFGTVLIPEAVYLEVVEAGSDRPGATELRAAQWVVKETVDPLSDLLLAGELGAGEAEAITLARKRNARLVLLDERRARRIAALAYHLDVKGSAGVLVLAKKKGLIPSVRPLLEAMRDRGYFLSQRVIDAACLAAAEQ